MPAEGGEPVLLYDNDFWTKQIGQDVKNPTLTQKLHLVFSLIVYLELSFISFLEFYFSSSINAVKRRAGSFMAFRPTADPSKQFAPARLYQLWHDSKEYTKARPHLHDMVAECAREMALEESDRIIMDKSLQIRLSELTISKMRELLSPAAIIERYQAHAPFMWSLLMVFSASPNKYRTRFVPTAEEDVEMEVEGSSDDIDSDATDTAPTQRADIPDMPSGFSRNPVLVRAS